MLRAVTAYGNTGIICLSGLTAEWQFNLNMSTVRGHYYGLVFELNGVGNNCNFSEATYHFYMSHSNFDRNSAGALLVFESVIYSVSLIFL